MFSKSWTTGRSKGGNKTYPGHRATNGASATTTTTTTATTAEQSISISRKEHLDSYLNDEVLGRSTMKVSSDDTTYDTVFSTVSGDTLILRVHFPSLAFTPGASVQAPEMKLTGATVTHPWLDGNLGRVIGYNPCSSDRAFRDSRMLLGQAVKQVVQEFQLNPPKVIKFTDPHLKKMQPNNNNNNHNDTASNEQQSIPESNPSSVEPPAYDDSLFTAMRENNFNNNGRSNQSTTSSFTTTLVDLPSLPTQFPELNNMDREELEQMLNDESVFQSFCNDNIPVVKQMQLLVAEKSEEVAQMAQSNLNEEESLQTLFNTTQQLHDELKMIVQECQVLQQEQDNLQDKPNISVLMKELNKAKKVAFDESEQIADDWLNEDDKEHCASTMTKFCQEFLEKRIIHHLRASKIQILTTMQQQQREETESR